MDPQNNNPTPPPKDKPDLYEGMPDNHTSRGLTSNPYSTPQPEQIIQPQNQNGAINDPPEKDGLKLPKGPILAGIVGGVLVIILIIIVLIANSGKKPTPSNNKATTDTSQAQALQPAQSVELEQANNAINQDLSGLNDEKDLPNNSLDDLTLGL